MGNLLDPVLRPRDVRQRGLHARAGVQVHVPVRALPVGDVRSRHADHRLRHRARRAARPAQPQGGSHGGRSRPLRGLQHLRPGVSDRHRHPQGPAVRVHRLRGVHRRLRPGDGAVGFPKGLIRYASENALRSTLDSATLWRRMLRPRTLIYTGLARDHHRHRGVASRCAIRSRSTSSATVARSREKCRTGRDRERLPAADHEHRRESAAVHDLRHRRRPGSRSWTSTQPVEVGAAATRLLPIPVAGGGEVPAKSTRTRRTRKHRDDKRRTPGRTRSTSWSRRSTIRRSFAASIRGSSFRAETGSPHPDDKPRHAEHRIGPQRLVPATVAVAADRRTGNRGRRSAHHRVDRRVDRRRRRSPTTITSAGS